MMELTYRDYAYFENDEMILDDKCNISITFDDQFIRFSTKFYNYRSVSSMGMRIAINVENIQELKAMISVIENLHDESYEVTNETGY